MVGRLGATALALMAVAAAGSARADEAQPAPSYGSWGFDLGGRDIAVKPGDDFGSYASGTYLRSLKIPSDQARWGVFNILRDLSDSRVHAILEDAAAKAPVAPATDGAKSAPSTMRNASRCPGDRRSEPIGSTTVAE